MIQWTVLQRKAQATNAASSPHAIRRTMIIMAPMNQFRTSSLQSSGVIAYKITRTNMKGMLEKQRAQKGPKWHTLFSSPI